MEPAQPSGRILVVEDDPDIRNGLRLLLEDEGYAVATAAEGQEALDTLRGSLPPSLILLDLMMPVMDGFEFRVRQTADPSLADIPVIVLSSGGDLERKSVGLGAVACLRKPLDFSALLTLIARSCAVQ